jgi:hypothetical protein
MADPTKVDINEGKAAAPQPTQVQRDQNEAERARVDIGKDAGGTAGGANPDEPGRVHQNHLNMKEHNERELERRKRIDEHNAAGHAKNMKAIEETARADCLKGWAWRLTSILQGSILKPGLKTGTVPETN